MKNKINNEKGFSVVEVLLALVVLAIIGVAGYFVAKHVDNKSASSGQNTSKVSNASSSTSKLFKLSSWGVQASYRSSLTLEWTQFAGTNGTEEAFTSSQLVSAAKSDPSSNGCGIDTDNLDGQVEQNAGGGAIVRGLPTDTYAFPDSNGNPQTIAQFFSQASGVNYIQVGQYYYYYAPNQGSCASGSVGTLQTQTENLVKSLIGSLHAIPN